MNDKSHVEFLATLGIGDRKLTKKNDEATLQGMDFNSFWWTALLWMDSLKPVVFLLMDQGLNSFHL